ncbi:MAG: dehydrogenase [Cyanobacteria bacterium RYN_339]|nr:dehydrogenase [Cyanobacteria bacterium RYN_339]
MHLFTPLTLRGVTLRNRIAVSPMCQYSSTDGLADDWHLVHLGSRAVGGAGLVLTEAAAVTPDGRISPQDLGLWGDQHVAPLARVTRFIRAHGAVAGIQLAHAGRKASTYRPWDGTGAVTPAAGGWLPVWGPDDRPFTDGYPVPTALTPAGLHGVVKAFGEAARRSVEAGFELIEIHAAHGYLIHEFLSPLSNQRTDAYGGSFENRTRLAREVVGAVRAAVPERFPVIMRVSCSDWTPGGWDVEQTIELARQVGPLGIDLFDCSSGGNVPRATIPVGPGYQTDFAAKVRLGADLPTGAVGMITDAAQADHVIRTQQADMVFIARELLRDPYWPLHAARQLGHEGPWPPQYERAKLR